jgi:hypothetical protein
MQLRLLGSKSYPLGLTWAAGVSRTCQTWRLLQTRRPCTTGPATRTARDPVSVDADVSRDIESGADTAQTNEEEGPTENMWNGNAPAGPEWGGPRGDEPTKFGDWAKNGRVSDF